MRSWQTLSQSNKLQVFPLLINIADKKEQAKEAEIEQQPTDQEEEHSVLMGIDEFYPDDHVDKVIEDSTISRRNKRFLNC